MGEALSPRPARPRWLAAPADDLVLRALFGAMLAATAAVLYVDYHDFSAAQEARARAAPASEPSPTADKGAKMTFDLTGGGRLLATGAIAPGTAQAFAAEIEKRGGYVKTVVLHSPGGSVQDAMAMGRLIRAKNLATEIESGRMCVSSCPLVFAGGVARKAGAKAELGVHQVAAAGPHEMTQSEAMEDAQRVSAQVQNYLREMGIDLGLWVRAMATPNKRLYDLTPAEMLELKLATEVDGGDKVAKPRGKTRS